MFPFLKEVESEYILHRTISVRKPELALPVAIGVEVDDNTGKVLGIVPEKAGAEEYVGTYPTQYRVVVVGIGDVGLAVSERRYDADGKYAVTTERPVVAIPDADGIVTVRDVIEQERGVDVLRDVRREHVGIEVYANVIVREPQFPRALAAALYGILTKCSRPRVTAVVEDVLGINAEAAAAEPTELAVFGSEVDAGNVGDIG